MCAYGGIICFVEYVCVCNLGVVCVFLLLFLLLLCVFFAPLSYAFSSFSCTKERGEKGEKSKKDIIYK